MNEVQVQGFMLAKRAPVVGEVEFFTADEETSKAGKPYTRIRRNSSEYGGSSYKILEASPTGGDADRNGNLGYSVTLAATNEAATPVEQRASTAPPSKQDQREHNIAQAGAYNAAVEVATTLLHNGDIDVAQFQGTVEAYHTQLLPFRQSIVGIEPAPPTEPVAAADENGQPPEPDPIPF